MVGPRTSDAINLDNKHEVKFFPRKPHFLKDTILILLERWPIDIGYCRLSSQIGSNIRRSHDINVELRYLILTTELG